MHRARITLFVALAAAGFARADDPKAAGHDHKPAGPIKYEAAVHDHATGHHNHLTFDLNNPADKQKLFDLIAHGEVKELENKSPPTLPAMASWRADLGLWTLVIFGLLLFILSRMAWPKMLAGLQKREANIRGALDEAQKARDEANSFRTQFQQEMAQAHLKVKEIVDEARRDATALREEEMTKTKAEIAAERERLHREIAMETDQALQTIWAKAADLATLASASALKKQLDGNMQRKLIDEALTELRTAAN